MDNRIQYQFTAGTAGFDNAVASLNRSMREVRSTFTREMQSINGQFVNASSGFSRMGPAANDAMAGVQTVMVTGMRAATAGVVGAVAAGVYGVVKLVGGSKDALIQQQASFRGLEAVANHSGVGIGRAMAEVEKLTADGLVSVADASKALQNLLSRGYSVDQAVATINRLKDAAAFNRQSNLGLSEAVLTATEGLKNENSVLVDNAGVTKNVAKMWEEYAKSIGTTRDKLTDSQKIQAEYLGIMKETEAQVGNAAKAADGLTGSQAQLDFKSNELQVTLGTILEPAFIRLNEKLAATAGFFNDLLRAMGDIPRSVSEIEGDIGRLEQRLSNLGRSGGRSSGPSRAYLQDQLSGLKDELLQAQLTSKDAEVVGVGIAKLEQRLQQQRGRVAELGAGSASPAVTTGSGRNRKVTAYGEELQALKQLEQQMTAAVAHQQELKAAINTPPKPGNGGDGNTPTTSRVSQWSEALDAQKVAHAQQQAEAGTFRQFSLQQEANYWQSILQRTDLSASERLGVQRKYLAALQGLRRQDEGQAFADLQAQAQQYRNNMDARLQIAQQTLQRAAQLYGTDSQEYQRAAQEVVAIEREKQQQITQLKQQSLAAEQQARLADIAQAEQLAQMDLQAGLITQEQLLAQQRQFEDRKYAIEREALQRRMALLEADPDRDPVALQQIQQQIEALQQQHGNRIVILGRQQQQESMSGWNGMLGSIRQSWTSGLNGILTGTQSTAGLLQGIWSSIATAFIEQMVTEPLMAWVVGEAQKTAATMAGVGTRNAAEATGAAASTAIWGAAAIKNILSSAYQAMAGAFAAMTAIPIVGPALGAAAAVAAGAFVFGLVKNVASAEGGYDIPAGTNPLTQLHEQEMVLPKQYANVIRRAADGEGGLGGGNTVNYHDYSGRLTPSEIRRNVGVIARELQRLGRNNGLVAS